MRPEYPFVYDLNMLPDRQLSDASPQHLYFLAYPHSREFRLRISELDVQISIALVNLVVALLKLMQLGDSHCPLPADVRKSKFGRYEPIQQNSYCFAHSCTTFPTTNLYVNGPVSSGVLWISTTAAVELPNGDGTTSSMPRCTFAFFGIL